MEEIDPYQIKAGPELDQIIHEQLFGEPNSDGCPTYSTSTTAANRVKSKLKSTFTASIVTGKTRIRRKPYFARHNSGPSTSTEILAESYPLAICRLAVLLIQREYG